MSFATQSRRIAKRLANGLSITGYEAMTKMGIGHLPRRILDLKERGYEVSYVWETNLLTGSRYKRWYMTLAQRAKAAQKLGVRGA